MIIKSKDQDFAISKPMTLGFSSNQTSTGENTKIINIPRVVAECKTNLDKTMFQEASATAYDIKSSVIGCKYYLLCEWLDMTPVSTQQTNIDSVYILRKAKRISSNKRTQFNTRRGRQKHSEWYKNC